MNDHLPIGFYRQNEGRAFIMKFCALRFAQPLEFVDDCDDFLERKKKLSFYNMKCELQHAVTN